MSGQVDGQLDPEVAALLKRDAAGLVAAVVQQHDTGEVLMVGWMNDDALARTLTSGRVTFWSRSRQELWRKGDKVGPACHTGARSCFDTHPLDAVTGGPGG
jgi:phosphoribosyl-AMP cyclohydrolase